MVSRLIILSSVLLASTVLAAQSSQLKARLVRRHNRRQSGLVNRDDNVEYNDLWSGAIWDENNGDFNTITGTFTVPTVTGPGVGSAWVGIDGRGFSPGLLQAGVDFWIADGEPSYHAWYQWFPQDSVYDIMDVNVGDVIKVTVSASSTTSGNVVMENLSTQTVFKHSLSYPKDYLSLRSVEWILEDYNGDSGALIDFGSVTFNDATASGPSGKIYTPSGATSIAEIQQNGTVYTSTTTTESSVTINYI